MGPRKAHNRTLTKANAKPQELAAHRVTATDIRSKPPPTCVRQDLIT